MFRRFCLQTAEAATGGVLLRKIFLKISQISKAYELESPFNKVAGLQACIFIKKKLQHRCFPVKFAKVLRTPILKIICERLLLRLVSWSFLLNYIIWWFNIPAFRRNKRTRKRVRFPVYFVQAIYFLIAIDSFVKDKGK